MNLRISDDLTLPIDLVTEPIGVLANRGRGKTYATHALVEEIHDVGVPVVILDVKGDWYGVRTSSDGKADGMPFYIFGGDHADLPLEPTAGELLADLVVDERVSVVLDLSLMSKTKARSFTTTFAERLYHRNRDNVFLVVDEADVLIPQRATADTARLLGAMEDIAKRGRGRGIGMAVVTQRPQEVAKSVLDLMDTLLLLGMTGPRALKSVREWIGVHVDEDVTASDVMASLPSLPVGTAWVWSPMLKLLQKTKIRRLRTYDSHPTPKPGQQRKAPRRRTELDLTALGERITATVEQAKANDPKALRRRITELEQELAAVEPTIERVEVTVPDRAAVDGLRVSIDALAEKLGDLMDPILAVTEHADRLVVEAAMASTQNPHQEAATGQPTTRRSAPRATSTSENSRRARDAGASAHRGITPPAARETRPVAAGGPPDGDVVLRSGARRMVEALGRMHPLRLTKAQWGTVAKLKTSGGTWSTYLSDIRRAGLVEENPAGYTLTDAGFDYLGGRPDPMDATELQDHYRGILRSGASKMLDALLQAHPAGLTRQELGDAAGIAITGGTFSTYLSDLVRNGLAERQGEEIVATDILVYGSAA